MATNKSSKFTDVSLPLANGMTITGIYYNPPKAKTYSIPYRPLMVLIHGGSCTAHNFDISATNTASSAAEQLSMPVLSINRPDYLDSSPMPSIPEDSTYHQTLGKEVYHDNLLPTLWEKYGKPEGCTSLVLLGHSLACPAIIFAAGTHAQDAAPGYPLSGIIMSGWGSRPIFANARPPTDTNEDKSEWKQLIMLSDCSAVSESIIPHIKTQNHPIARAELEEHITGTFGTYWRRYSDAVEVPIMYGMGEKDELWEGTLEHVREYETMFPKSRRFDGSVVVGAPHAIEWSLFAEGWYARCFGFASEVATLHGLRKGV